MATAHSLTEDRFYLAIGIYVFALGALGFARNFYLLPLGSEPLHDSGPIYFGTIIHGLACTAWLALAVWQPWLILTNRRALHRASGRWGALIALLVFVTGIHVSLVQAIRFAGGEGNAGFVIVPLGIMAGFALSFGLALHYRRKTDLHKRWIVIAHCMILEPAAARALGTLEMPVFPAIILLIALPVLAGAAFDAVRHRRIPWLYLLGIVFVIGSGFVRQGVARDPGWTALIERLIGA
ncbi:MAG: hypothetical protein ACX930_15445 [Erythrobacter sp.]